jgi:hypothetical protein
MDPTKFRHLPHLVLPSLAQPGRRRSAPCPGAALGAVTLAQQPGGASTLVEADRLGELDPDPPVLAPTRGGTDL